MQQTDERPGSANERTWLPAIGPRPWAAPRLWGLLLVAASLISLCPTGRAWAIAWLVLHLDVPSSEAMEIRMRTISDPVASLVPLWRTNRIPQRLFAINKIRDHRGWIHGADWPAEIERIVTDAAWDPDMEVRVIALYQLAAKAHPLAATAARAAVHDPDPVLRLAGIKVLARCGNRADADVAIQLLRDPDPDVQVAAAGVLRKWTGRDFGICDSTLPAARNRITAEAESWWQQNRQIIQSGSVGEAAGAREADAAARFLPVANVRVRDLSGRSGWLKDFLGANRHVLLVFWKTTDPISRRTLADLARNEHELPTGFCFLPVCVDRVPTRHVGGEHVHDVPGRPASRRKCSCDACAAETGTPAHSAQHKAVHGGTLYEIRTCENGHVEVRLDDGVLRLWFVGGGNATDRAVRVPDSEIALRICVEGERKSRQLVLLPAPDALAEETSGNCSRFEGSADWLGEVESFDASGTVTFRGVREDFQIEECLPHSDERTVAVSGHAVPGFAAVQGKLRRMAAERHLNCPQLIDDGAAAMAYCANELPTFVLFDEQGRLGRRFVGPRNREALVAMLTALQTR